jgi:hypothetical protein
MRRYAVVCNLLWLGICCMIVFCEDAAEIRFELAEGAVATTVFCLLQLDSVLWSALHWEISGMMTDGNSERGNKLCTRCTQGVHTRGGIR